MKDYTSPVERHVFIPHLPLRARVAPFVTAGLSVLGLVVAVVFREIWYAGIIFALFMSWVTYLHLLTPRQVVFSDAIIIYRRILPSKIIEYRDITSFGIGRIRAHTGSMAWLFFENSHEIDDIFDQLVDNGTIRVEQLDDRAYLNDRSSLEAVFFSTAIMSLAFIADIIYGIIASESLFHIESFYIALIYMSLMALLYSMFRYTNILSTRNTAISLTITGQAS